MLAAAELGTAVAKTDYEARVPGLRVDLINAQYDLRSADFPMIVVLAGDDRAGVNEVLNLLHEWMDARQIETSAFGRPTEEERQRPRFWRYWKALPRRGRLAVVIGDWATALLADRIFEEIDDGGFEHELDHVERFERALVDDGALLLKIWLHLPKKELKKRLKKARRDEGTALRVDETDRRILDAYDELLPIAERLLHRTSTAGAPWTVVESTDTNHRDLAVAGTILGALQARLAEGPREPAAGPVLTIPDLDPDTSVLDSVDLGASLAYDEYRERLLEVQTHLRELAARARRKGVSSVLVLEGWDAAGKGGVIRRMVHALDARDYRTVAIAAPSEEEKARHYLWRFWRRLPRAGEIVIFDRSWYGRVLVERVEGFAQEAEWRRAYAEIVDFEAQITAHGAAFAKFWLHVDPEEQLRRFAAREKTPYKKYKIGAEDYRNRRRWDDYVAAVDEMVARTSTPAAPWHLISANDKRHARVTVLGHVCDALKRAVKNA